jgi:oligopeptide/dipeptide ABC transporter ATP-binding protein
MLLDVVGLKTYFYVKGRELKAVDGVSFSVDRGETLGIVGESGCGKSVMSMSVLKLIDQQAGKITEGKVIFDGKDLMPLSGRDMAKIRGNEISMIFQEPMTSLNPVFTIGHQINESVITHQNLDKSAAALKSIELLNLVRIPDAERIMKVYPHQLSGGMRQRAMIAMSLACNPKLLIADEPTTALDVTIQAQVLELIRDIKKNLDMALILITHDLGVIAEMADNILVMYAGKVIEQASVTDLFKSPKHPYTLGLMKSKPNIMHEQENLHTIPGNVPSLYEIPSGCAFHPRCEHAHGRCAKAYPPMTVMDNGRRVACWQYNEEV